MYCPAHELNSQLPANRIMLSCCCIVLSPLFFVMSSALELNINPWYFFKRVYIHLLVESLTDHFNTNYLPCTVNASWSVIITMVNCYIRFPKTGTKKIEST